MNVGILIAFNHCGALSLALSILLDELLDLRLAEVVKPRLCESFNCGQSLLRIEREHTLAALQGFRSHFAHVPTLQSLRLGLRWELKTDEARILIEKLLLMGCEFAQDLLDAEQLVNF